MTVIGVGDLQLADGAKFPGIIIEASREELQEMAGNILYKEVNVVPANLEYTTGKNGNLWDGKFGEMVDALCAVDGRVRGAKPSRKYTRDEVLAMLDEIDPEDRTKGGAE